MMRAWFFTENAWPYIPDPETLDSVRVSLPNSYYDPVKGADLYHERIEEWKLADELGLEIFANEHHQTITCLDGAGPLIMSILARETKRARLLFLGNPIATRTNPVRIAEEMATVDVISRGRLEMGFVRGVPMEMSPSNANPVDLREREQEGIELVIKAMTTHDGPFNWEGKHFQYRQVNIWPRPWQQPHPPIWVATGTPSMAEWIGERNYVAAGLQPTIDESARAWNFYKRRRLELGLSPANEDRFAHLCLLYVGDTDEEGIAGARKLKWYIDANHVAPQFGNPPGYLPAEIAARQLRNGPANRRFLPVETLIERGEMFAGNPETVFNQIKTIYDRVGGFGNILVHGQAGHTDFKETEKNLTLFSREVYPRLKELRPPESQPSVVVAAGIRAETVGPQGVGVE